MENVWLVITTNGNFCEQILEILSSIEDVNIKDRKDSQIIISVSNDDIHLLNKKIKEITEINGVANVYPVFSRESLSV